MIGTTVQITSKSVLCVVLVGTGLRPARNRMMTYPMSPRTKSAMSVETITKKSWKLSRRSMTGEAGSGNPICQSRGAPS